VARPIDRLDPIALPRPVARLVSHDTRVAVPLP
jgi:hypothetical protein